MAAVTNRKPMGKDEKIMKTVCYIVVGFFALICLFPFLLMITSSFMTEKEIVSEGFKLIPDEISFSAYQFLMENSQKLIDAYAINLINVIFGTTLGLFFMSMAGYVLCRKDFKYRNQISFFIYFKKLFSGVLIHTYM